METVVSGIRPTGNLHLGNYFGAVKNFLKMQDEYKCFFFIADWHSLTTHPHPGNVVENVRKILAEYLACGLDPEKATIYVQSDIKEIAELYLYLNMNAYLASSSTMEVAPQAGQVTSYCAGPSSVSSGASSSSSSAKATSKATLQLGQMASPASRSSSLT